MCFVSAKCSLPFLVMRSIKPIRRSFSRYSNVNAKWNHYAKYIPVISSGILAFAGANFVMDYRVQALQLKKLQGKEENTIKLTARERRFIKFSSVEYNGQLYMTPQDFLDSVVEQEPRPRLKRRSLTLDEINVFKNKTPALKKGSEKLFRGLRDKGIISYTEYLFLLSVLTKPHSGFRIAFNMFDTDGNRVVDKTEFLIMQTILNSFIEDVKLDSNTRKLRLRLHSPKSDQETETIAPEKKTKPKNQFMERIFSGAWREKRQKKDDEKTEVDAREQADTTGLVSDEEGLQRTQQVDTMLQVHFFGTKGDKVLRYENFYKFMDDLQTEVLQLEFSEFSKGNIAITEVDFAKILLRYTYLNTDEYETYLERLLDRVKDESGITFNEFRDFCRFLNNLDDFSMAMRMYTLADRAISKDEFKRAVKICTGFTLTDHLVDTLFAVFDENNDGMLSYKEFIAIMKDRLHRGLKSVAKAEGWDAFKHCVTHELRMSHK